ncbi:Bacterial ABC transporter protein EcsB [compost metagenome]
MLYIVIPIALILTSIHVQLWVISLPAWLVSLPFMSTSVLLFVLISFSGGLIVRLEAADVLFIRQQPIVTKTLKRYGLILSLSIQVLLIMVVVLYISPILIRVYTLSLLEIVQLFLILSLLKCIHMLAHSIIVITVKGWLGKGLSYLVTAIIVGLYSLWLNLERGNFNLIAVIFIATVLFLSWYRMNRIYNFDVELAEDQKQKGRLTSYLLVGAVDKPRKLRTKPILFKKSNKLFKLRTSHNRIAEVIIKSFVRDKEFKVYLQMSSLALVSVIITPTNVSIVIGILILFLFVYFIEEYRRYFFKRRLMEVMPLTEITRGTAYLSSIGVMNGLMRLPILLLTFGIVTSSWGWIWGLIVSVPVSWGLAWWVSRNYFKWSPGSRLH